MTVSYLIVHKTFTMQHQWHSTDFVLNCLDFHIFTHFSKVMGYKINNNINKNQDLVIFFFYYREREREKLSPNQVSSPDAFDVCPGDIQMGIKNRGMRTGEKANY